MKKVDFYYEKNKYGIDITERGYEEISPFSEGFSRVKKDNKYSFMDKNGEEMVPFLYDEAHNFHQALAAVKTDDRWHYEIGRAHV